MDNEYKSLSDKSETQAGCIKRLIGSKLIKRKNKKITPTNIGKDKILTIISKEKELSQNKANKTLGQLSEPDEIEKQSIINLQKLASVFN